ncbi:hypothetical protein JHK82_029914 [Glycine max]|nr:hypothetical protein JHK82_029914 [Glycine max]
MIVLSLVSPTLSSNNLPLPCESDIAVPHTLTLRSFENSWLGTKVWVSPCSDGGKITTAHVLLGIWSEVDSPGHKILSTLGFNEEKKLKSFLSPQFLNLVVRMIDACFNMY